jgi:hypothetical protein
MSTQAISFKVRNIDIHEFAFVHPKQPIPVNSIFRFETQIEHKVNVAEKIIMVISTFVIHCDTLNEKVGNAVISCVYNIDNIGDFVNENKNFVLPEQLLTMFNSISISTCRGVLFTLFRGTPLHNVILPVINPADMNKQQV